MKRIISILIITVLFTACKSSSKQLERGDYDAALQKSAKKIKRNPSKNSDEVWVFNDAYKMATTRDEEAIMRLKRKGDPALWSKIYRTYVKMDTRQNLAISLPPVGIEFDEKDFTSEINNSRLKAAEYAYAKGDQLLNIEKNLKTANSRDVAKKEESERNELDELFAEKKKW